MDIIAAVLVASLGATAAPLPPVGSTVTFPPPLPPAVHDKCARVKGQASDPIDAAISYARCVAAERERMEQPGYVATPAEAEWLAETHRQEAARSDEAAREARRKLLAYGYVAATIILGIYFAWRAGRVAAPTRGLITLGVYLFGSFIAFVFLTEFLDNASTEDAMKAGVFLHAHWAALLSVLVYRCAIRSALLTGWGRLFVVVWAVWAGWVAMDLYNESWIDAEQVLRFTVGGLALPVALAFAIRWVARGFAKPKPNLGP